ncbi:hypothetical protein L208DRAFT_1463013, partial [Tricholoma matsutake]
MSNVESEDHQNPNISVLAHFFESDPVASQIDINTLFSYFQPVFPTSTEARMPTYEDLNMMQAPTIKRRTSGGFPLTIPEFATWATRAGIDSLKVCSISYWKFQTGWQHEFLEVSLAPDPTFGLDVVEIPGMRDRFVYYDVAKNVRGGLRFRIDRGQRPATRSDPSSTRSLGHRFALDVVELIDNTVAKDSKLSCDVFTLGRPVPDTPQYEHFQIRVYDIIFVLNRALEAFGPDYALLSRNCWAFASFIIQSITLLFHGDLGGPDLGVEGSLVRGLFPGSQLARDVFDLGNQPNLFSTGALLGIRKDKDLSVLKNPFCVLLIRAVSFCILSINCSSLADLIATSSHAVHQSQLLQTIPCLAVSLSALEWSL